MINKAGFKISQAHTGVVTLIQRFGSAMNLNLHFHMLFIDGVFSPKSNGQLRFHRVNAPTSKELNALVATLSELASLTFSDCLSALCSGRRDERAND